MQIQTRDAPEYLKAFNRYLRLGKGRITAEEHRTLQEGADADGNYLAPSLYADFIAEIRRHSFAGLVTRIETGKSISIPYFNVTVQVKELTESPTLGSGGSYGLGSGSDSSPFNIPNFGTSGSPDRRAFKTQKKGVYTKVTEELLDDSAPDLLGFLFRQLGIAIYAAEGDQIVNGDGNDSSSGEMCGLIRNLTAESRTVSAASSSGIATGTGASSNDLAEVLDLVDPSYFERGVWLMHPRVYVKHVAGAAGAAHVVMHDGVQRPSVYGLPVVLCPWMPSAPASGAMSVIFGDLSQYVVAETKPGYVFSAHDQAHIASGQIGIYARTRLDGNVVQPKAFAGLLHA